MQAIILSGALTDGLSPLTHMQHVPTLPVGNVPLIFYLMGMLRHNDVSDFTININHGADNVYRLMQKIKTEPAEKPLNISYSIERQLVGSANVLHRVSVPAEEPLVVAMGDMFLEGLDLKSLECTHKDSGAAVTVLASRKAGNSQGYGVIEEDSTHRLISLRAASPAGSQQLENTNTLYNTGFYIFDPSVIEFIPENESFQIGRDLLPKLIAMGREVRVVETDRFFQRITSFDLYLNLNLDLTCQKVKPAYQPLQLSTPHTPAKINPTASLEGPVIFGNGCKIGSEVVIKGPAVIGNNVTIKSGAQLKECVVMPNTIVGLATKFERTILYGCHAVNAGKNQVVNIVDPAVLQARKRDQFKQALEQSFHSLVALILLLVLSPLLLIVAVAIMIDSPGPLWYKQLRVGQHREGDENLFYPGKVFSFYKFRSMYVDASSKLELLLENNSYKTATFVKLKNDPRITRVGRFIRKTSIDELPQLINVIKGDMRLVGNRPLPLYEALKLSESWQQVRFSAPAGLTGLWQISGRSDLSREERIILDNFYAVTRSFRSDLKILVLTIPAVLLQRGSH